MANPRADFSAIVDRPLLELPGNARVAVMLVVNVEDWEFDQAPVRPINPPPVGTSRIPDVQNYSWFEYGLRVGFWRILEATERLGIEAVMSLNAVALERYPRVTQAAIDAGWEVLAHSYLQRPLPVEEDERAVIRQTIDVIKAHTGSAPRGWMGPAMAETFATPDILAEEGFEYVLDWMSDDQPFPLKVASGELLAIPYTVELNDIPIYLGQHQPSSALYDRCVDHLETLLSDEPRTARLMPIGVHPFIVGQPHRFKHFLKGLELLKSNPSVAFMTGSEVLDWYRDATK